MATEYPPLSKIHVVGYSANDKDYAILNQLLDPRVAGYKVPEDFSACPDKRYPNHIFTGAQPISGDQRVRHTWEILPSPWVPFTRYDDDLGPIQGKRRSVKNEGQQASLTSSTKISYEGREGSSLVLTELEETWSIKTDDDGNSLFPVKIRDFYDPSRGAVEERRQLFVPTGEEVATLENINGIITETSYEAYNEYLSYKIVRTYSVNGPLLTSNATNNEGQLVSIKTQRKASDGYVAPQPTATRTVETTREDAESLIERIVDAPNVFNEKLQSVEKPDTIPAEFRATNVSTTTSSVSAGTSTDVVLGANEVSKTKQRVTENKVRETTTTRPATYDNISGEFIDNDGVKVTRTKTLAKNAQSISPSATTSGSVEGIGDGYTVKTLDTKQKVFDGATSSASKEENIPLKFRAAIPTQTLQSIVPKTFVDTSLSVGGGVRERTEQRLTEWTVKQTAVTRNDSYESVQGSDLDESWNIPIRYTEEISSSVDNSTSTEYDGLGDGKHVKRTYTTSNLDSILGNYKITIPTKINVDLPKELLDISVEWEEKKSISDQGMVQDIGGNNFNSLSLKDSGSVSSTLLLVPNFTIKMSEGIARDIDATVHIFFLKKNNLTKAQIKSKTQTSVDWPKFAPADFSKTFFGKSETKTITKTKNRLFTTENDSLQVVQTTETSNDLSVGSHPVVFQLPHCIRKKFELPLNKTLTNEEKEITLVFPSISSRNGTVQGSVETITLNHEIKFDETLIVPATEPYTKVPDSGTYVISISAEPYKFDWFLVRATVIDASDLPRPTALI